MERERRKLSERLDAFVERKLREYENPVPEERLSDMDARLREGGKLRYWKDACLCLATGLVPAAGTAYATFIELNAHLSQIKSVPDLLRQPGLLGSVVVADMATAFFLTIVPSIVHNNRLERLVRKEDAQRLEEMRKAMRG